MLSFNRYLEEATAKGLLGSNEIKNLERFLGRRGVPLEDKEDALKLVYNFLKKDLTSVHKNFKKFLGKLVPRKLKQKTKILTGIKTVESVISKAIKRKKPFSGIKDLVRGAVLFEHQKDATDLYDDIVRKHSGKIIRKGIKRRGSDPKFGYYGSYHVNFILDGLPIELQIMTRKLWKYKEAAHEFYNKYRDRADATPDRFDSHLSRMIFSKGNQGKFIKEDLEIISELVRELMLEGA